MRIGRTVALVVGVLLGLSVAFGAAAQADTVSSGLGDDSGTSCPPAIAHRGTGAGASGGTIDGFVNSLEVGASALEMDVRFTSTGVPVVYHDATIDADTDGTGAIASMSYTQLAQYPINGSNEPIPTLAAVLRATYTYHRGYIIEFKTKPSAAELATYMTHVNNYKIAARLTVESVDSATLTSVHKLQPTLKEAWILTKQVSPASVAKVSRSVIPEWKITTTAYVDALHKAGVANVWVWTVNDPDQWPEMSSLHVDGVMTDDVIGYLAVCSVG